METYSVQKFCNMVGVPYSSLRYYERIGLLKPRQNDNNNYREYTAYDAFKVNRFKSLRALDFDVKEVLALLEEPTEVFGEKIKIQEEKIKVEINLMQAKIEQLKKLKNNIEIINMEGQYLIKRLNDKFFLPASEGHDFNISNYDDMAEWVDLLPITTYSKRIKKEYITKDKEIVQDYGLSIDLNKAYLLDIEKLSRAEYLEGGNALVFYSKKFNHKSVEHDAIEDALTYLKDKKYNFKGHIYLEGAGVVDSEGENGQIIYIPFD